MPKSGLNYLMVVFSHYLCVEVLKSSTRMIFSSFSMDLKWICLLKGKCWRYSTFHMFLQTCVLQPFHSEHKTPPPKRSTKSTHPSDWLAGFLSDIRIRTGFPHSNFSHQHVQAPKMEESWTLFVSYFVFGVTFPLHKPYTSIQLI